MPPNEPARSTSSGVRLGRKSGTSSNTNCPLAFFSPLWQLTEDAADDDLDLARWEVEGAEEGDDLAIFRGGEASFSAETGSWLRLVSDNRSKSAILDRLATAAWALFRFDIMNLFDIRN